MLLGHRRRRAGSTLKPADAADLAGMVLLAAVANLLISGGLAALLCCSLRTPPALTPARLDLFTAAPNTAAVPLPCPALAFQCCQYCRVEAACPALAFPDTRSQIPALATRNV